MAQPGSIENSPVLHVVVIGFHHKKGCQVEYSYPPLIEGNPVDSHDVPEEWKHLPSLGLPDGAHNFLKDTIFFHLPSRDKRCKTVYGVACYRQMDSSDLLNRTSDVTRSTVQKSVCVLSRLPLYGLVKAKLELITHAYFDEKDFSKVELLEDTYKNLCIGLTEDLRDGSQVFLGMSARDVVIQFRHKIVLLFKLVLLERRVLFFGAPVEHLCNVLLSVLSLFPGMIEFGLEEAASCGLSKQISPTLYSANFGSENGSEADEFLEVRYHDETQDISSVPGVNRTKTDASVQLSVNTQEVYCNMNEEPESPTISRGCELDNSLGSDSKQFVQSNHKHSTDTHEIPRVHRKDSLNCDTLKNSKNQSNEIIKHTDSLLEGQGHQDHHGDGLKVKLPSSGDTNVNSSVEDSHTREISQSLTDSEASYSLATGSNSNSPVIVTSEESPFSSANFVTLESVQTGKVVAQNDSVINIEAYSEQFENDDSLEGNEEPSKLEMSLNLEENLLNRSDSIEELDSPESILKIDREDCFSWEEDRLLLTIKDENDSRENSGEHLTEGSKSHNSEGSRSQDVEKASSDPAQSENQQIANYSSANTKDQIEDEKDDVFNAEDGSQRETTVDKSVKSSPSVKAAALKNKLSSAFGGWNVKEKVRAKRQSKGSASSPTMEVPMTTIIDSISVFQQDEYGLPLLIFSKGCICYPYLSLQYYDLMENVNVRGFMVGATNILFKQKRHLTDVVIDVNDGRIEFHDRELQKQLNLTTEDLRFADILVKAVIDDKDDIYLDGTEWEGGDEWLRAQFKVYLHSLLSTVQTDDARLIEDFGSHFVHSWKTTHNYRAWANGEHPGVKDLITGHPCQGNLGVADIKMRLSHNLSSTERGKKINAAVVQTGKYVEQAGKAVGGALTQARSSISSWFSSFTQDWKKDDK